MAFGFSIGDFVAVASLCSNLASAVVSTQYDVERTRRELEDLTESLRSLERTLNKYKNTIEYLAKPSESCKRMQSLHPNLIARCPQLNLSRQSIGQMLLKEDLGGSEARRGLAEHCRLLVHCWESNTVDVEPALWKLQRWATRIADNLLLLVRKRQPSEIRWPSPTILLMSWLVMILAVAAYYETHPGHRYRKAFLLGSVVAAITIGVIEDSSVDTMMLTNLPWCLALSILLDTLVQKVLGNSTHGIPGDGLQSRIGHHAERGKVDPA